MLLNGDAPTSTERLVRCDQPHPARGSLVRRGGPTWYGVTKVSLDFLFALVLLVLALPVLLLAALAIKLTSRGPVIYSQVRLGRGARPYTIYKLRTMSHNCERHTGACWASVGDPRITPVGRFLRWTHIDELPQLWNVLRLEMSLVGPRPERPEFVPLLEQAIPGYRERLLVRPGITGLAQVQLPPDTDISSVRRKLACDLYYVERVGFWLDLRILLITACQVVGVPFAWSGKLFVVPAGEKVERAYETAVANAVAFAQLQPA
jgi:lipopolysaccharide/colanic/teichoic acid biosynthesis glycosyltransferase